MSAKILQLLNIHPGEEKQAISFSLVAFLWAAAIFSALTLSDGLFLENVGAESLPYYYITSALIMPAFAVLIVYSLNFFGIDRIFLTILAIGILVYLSLSILFNPTSLSNSPYYFYIFKLLCTILCSITLSAFWSFADQFYDMQKAKRIFCLFNSMIYIGDSIGGLLVVCVLPTAGFRPLLLIIALMLSASLYLTLKLPKKYSMIVEERKEDNVAERNSFSGFFKSLLTSPFTLSFVGITFMTYLICAVTEFNYQSGFEKAFKVNGVVQDHQLTIFMGKCAFVISLINMIFGLTCYSRIVKRIGVNNLAPVTSVMFISLFTGWHLIDHLVIAIIGFTIVKGVVYAIDDNNFNLLLNAVPPKIKYSVRIFLDSFVEHFGLALGGVVLLLSPPKYYLFLGLFLSFICLFIVLILKSAYPKAIYQNLVETAIYFEKTLKCFFSDLDPEKKENTQRLLLANISRSNPCFLSYETLLRLESPSIVPKLIRRAEFLSLKDKLLVLSLFEKSPYKKNAKFIACLQKWLHTYSEESFKSELLFYLAKLNKLPSQKAKSLLLSPSFLLQLSGALSILQAPQSSIDLKEQAYDIFHQALISSKNNQLIKALEGIKIIFEERFLTHLEKVFEIQNEEINLLVSEILASYIKPKHDYLEDLVFTQLSKVSTSKTRINLITALLNLKSPEIVLRLLKTVVHFRNKEKTLLEISCISLALQIPEKLLEVATKASYHHRSRTLALRILKLSHPQILELYHTDLLKKELHRANFYKKKIFLLSQFPRDQVDELMTTLKAAKQNSTEFLTNLLLIDSPMENVDTFVFSLESKNDKIRSNAIESLEKACPKKYLSALDAIFSIPSSLFYAKGQHDLWRVLRLLYNELRFSLSSIDITISSIIEKQYLFPGMDLKYHKTLELKKTN
ncbi:Uncharacterized protein AB751O23_AC_00250 [Chlamydiales bacterium SCGC AB-751-O23]|jgi:ATP/ADP translocase|nr:Uncharacterized protein AB751O23_AC_00250 [Chlamydiales bacterium SCGC AB-751-O23]